MNTYQCGRPLFLAAMFVLVACDDATTTAPGGATIAVDGGSTATPGARPDLDAMARGGDCPAPTGTAINHGGDIVADEAWPAGIHRVTSNLRVLATVTLDACARVEVDPDFGIAVGAAPTVGKLVAKGRSGTKLEPVILTATDPARPWAAVVVDGTGSVDLSYTVLANGDAPGTQQNGGGILRVFGASSTSTPGLPSITKNVRADWLLLESSGGPGANMLRYAGFADDSTALAVRGAKSDALRIELGAAGALPKELLFSGNARDAIVVEETWSGTIPTTFVKRAVPYSVDGPLYVQGILDGELAVLNVEPGVTVRFGEGKGASGVYVGTSASRQGQIVARGTVDQPILFTSARPAPAPGDWMGLYFRAYPPSGTALEHVTIEYAGGDSSAVGAGCGPRDNDASVLVMGDRPADAWIRQSTLRFGGGETGIVLGWTSDEAGPDFVGDNVFQTMPTCRVSRWRAKTGPACPENGGNPTCL